jgi:hypothetical protein
LTVKTNDRWLQAGASRRTLLILGLLLLIGVPLAMPALAQGPEGEYFPEVIQLPNGFQPEGVAVSWKGLFFVGSLANGAIYRGDVVSGQGDVLVQGEQGRVAVGLSYDPRSDHLWVAGGPSGQGRVYDAGTGEALASYQLTDADTTFVNDVVVTLSGAYFTDSYRPYVYRVPLTIGGNLPGQDAVEAIQLGGDYQFQEGQFNANGIDAPLGGGVLLVVNSTVGALYWVEPGSGRAVQIDLGDQTVTNGDGILLDGDTVYVVQNQNNQIVVVRLDQTLLSGAVTRQVTNTNFAVPTTIDDYHQYLYAVNARLGTQAAASTEYSLVRVRKD